MVSIKGQFAYIESWKSLKIKRGQEENSRISLTYVLILSCKENGETKLPGNTRGQPVWLGYVLDLFSCTKRSPLFKGMRKPHTEKGSRREAGLGSSPQEDLASGRSSWRGGEGQHNTSLLGKVRLLPPSLLWSSATERFCQCSPAVASSR